MKQKPRGCPVNLSLIRRTSFTATACATSACSISSLHTPRGCHMAWLGRLQAPFACVPYQVHFLPRHCLCHQRMHHHLPATCRLVTDVMASCRQAPSTGKTMSVPLIYPTCGPLK